VVLPFHGYNRDLFDNIEANFWEQGLAGRLLFIPLEHIDANFPLDSPLKSKGREFHIRLIISELNKIPDIREVRSTEKWMEKYIHVGGEVIENRNIAVDELKASGRTTTSPEKRAKTKLPQLIVKLSIIYCAEREGWKEATNDKGEKYYYLEMDEIDFDRAMKDFNIHVQGYVEAYNTYQQRKQPDVKLRSTAEIESKITKILKKPLKGSRYTIDFKENHEDSPNPYTITAVVTPDDKGDYVKYSAIYNHLKAVGWKKTLDEMEAAGKVEIIDKNRFKNGKAIEIRGEQSKKGA
jgi:hypothetical protein